MLQRSVKDVGDYLSDPKFSDGSGQTVDPDQTGAL